MKKRNWIGIVLFLLPVLVLFIMYFIYPLLFVIVTSFTEWNGFSAMEFVGLANFKELYADSTFRLSLENNLVWALVLGFIQIPMAAVMAMILAREPKGWRMLRTCYFLPNVISAIALAMMWTAIYNADTGLLNGLLRLVGLDNLTKNWLGDMSVAFPAVIAQQLFYIGYFMVVILASRVGIDETYYEAAELDGANILQQEIYITIPMLLPILITTITLAMAYGIRHFESTYLMTNGGPAHTTSVLGIMLYRNLGSLNYGTANAIGTTLIMIGGALIGLIRFVMNRKVKKLL